MPLTVGAITGLGKAAIGLFQNNQANQIHPNYTPYTPSPYAAQQLGIAQQLFNGRMAGATNAEANIGTNQANTVSNINRNASDSNTALAAASGAQGQSNQAYNDLATKEAQNKYNLLGNLNAGYNAMTEEGNKVYQSNLEKYKMDVGQQAQLRGSAWQNIFSGANDIGAGFMLGQQQGQQNDFQNKYLNILKGNKGAGMGGLLGGILGGV